MRKSRWPAPPVPGGFGFALGFLAGIVATTVVVAAGATGHPGWSVAALAVAVAGVSGVTTPSAAIATAMVCWCLHDGFVLGRYGDLVFTAGSAGSAVVLLSAAVIALVAASAVRTARDRRVMVANARWRIPAQRHVVSEDGRDTARR